MRHVDIHRAGLAVEIEAPGLLEQLLARQDAAARLRQGEEQVKFLGAEVEGTLAEADFAAGGVNHQVREADRRGARFHAPFAAPQNRFDARNQFARVEGLGQVIVRAEFEAEDLVNVLVAGGEHEDGRGIVTLAQALADFEAIQFGEHHVQHDQRGAKHAHCFERGLAIRCGLDAKALTLQIHLRELQDGGFVVYEEDEVGGHGELVIGNW